MDIEQIRQGVEESLKLYPKIARPTLVHMVVAGAKPAIALGEYQSACNDVMAYLYEEVQNGRLIHTKGANGGIFKPTYINLKPMPDVPDLITGQVKAINDHVCPSCKNDKVSKTERTCWKCGSSLH